MNRHQEIWIDGVEYDLVYLLRSTYWEVILVDVETDEIVALSEGEGLIFEVCG